MATDIAALRGLHERATQSWEAFEASSLAEDQERRILPKWRCVADRLEKLGTSLDDGASLCSHDFVRHLNDMRGLYWDDPATAPEQRAIDDAAKLFWAVHEFCGGENTDDNSLLPSRSS